MPYSIQTKDGITIPNIPDEWAPDDARLKQMVMQRRSAASGAAQQVPTPQAGLGTAPAAAPAPPPQAPMPPPQAAMPPAQAAPVAPPADEGSWLPAMQPSTAQPSVRPVPKKNAGEPNAQYQAIQMGGAALMHGIDKEMKQLDYRPGTANLISQVLTPKDFEGVTNTDAYMAYQARSHGWIHGYLRLQSGQQVPEVEFNRYYHTFFPQPGEGEYVVKQKERLRQIAMDGVDAGLTRAQLDHVIDKLKESQARMGPPQKQDQQSMESRFEKAIDIGDKVFTPEQLERFGRARSEVKAAAANDSTPVLPAAIGAGTTMQAMRGLGAKVGGLGGATGLAARAVARRVPGLGSAMNFFDDVKDVANVARQSRGGLGRLSPDDIATATAAAAPAARAARAVAPLGRQSATYASPHVPDIVVTGAKRRARDSLGRFTAEK